LPNSLPPETRVQISVVVPAFNESARLGPSVAAICEHLERGDINWELIVVDDGSTDDTAKIVLRAQEGNDRIRLVQLPRNRGKGHAVRAGVLASRGDLVLISDADLSTPIEELDALRAAYRPGHAAVIGSRALAMSRIEVRQSRARETLGRLGNRFIRVLAVPGVADTQCGFKLFDGERGRAIFALTTIDGWGFDIELLHLCHRFGWPVAEVPVRWAHADGSRLRPGAYVQVLGEVVRTRLRHRRTRPPQLAPIPIPRARSGAADDAPVGSLAPLAQQDGPA
jgi:dolichyl-phosphate beta-glucosyltransferase